MRRIKIRKVLDFTSVKKFVEKRDYYTQLKDYVFSDNNFKLLGLYGLRRTGKTISMYQLANELELDDYFKDKFSYYVCSSNATFDDLDLLLEKDFFSGKKVIFIDEITALKDFIECSSILADYYVSQGMKIIVSGTDSLSLMLASNDRLYDRIQMIHTSYIPFGEFNRLLNKCFDEYIKYGGVLTTEAYQTTNEAKEYERTSIIDNILNSLTHNEELRIYPPTLTELYKNEEIVSQINKIISKASQTFTLKAINKDYKTIVLRQSLKNCKDYSKAVNAAQIDKTTKEYLNVFNLNEMNTNFSQAHLDDLKFYLRSLGVLVNVPSYKSLKTLEERETLELLIQPGMINIHAKLLRDELAKKTNWREDVGLENVRDFIKRTNRIIYGFIVENTILANTFLKLNSDDVYVSKYSVNEDYGMHEIDMLVCDINKNNTYLFEIKSSKYILKDHEKHLINKGFIADIEKNFAPVKEKIILYTGENLINKGIKYINIDCFLKELYINNSIDKIIEKSSLQLENFKSKTENNLKNEIENLESHDF